MAYIAGFIFPTFDDELCFSGLWNNSFPVSLNGNAHDTAVVLAWLEDWLGLVPFWMVLCQFWSDIKFET